MSLSIVGEIITLITQSYQVWKKCEEEVGKIHDAYEVVKLSRVRFETWQDAIEKCLDAKKRPVRYATPLIESWFGLLESNKPWINKIIWPSFKYFTELMQNFKSDIKKLLSLLKKWALSDYIGRGVFLFHYRSDVSHLVKVLGSSLESSIEYVKEMDYLKQNNDVPQASQKAEADAMVRKQVASVEAKKRREEEKQRKKEQGLLMKVMAKLTSKDQEELIKAARDEKAGEWEKIETMLMDMDIELSRADARRILGPLREELRIIKVRVKKEIEPGKSGVDDGGKGTGKDHGKLKIPQKSSGGSRSPSPSPAMATKEKQQQAKPHDDGKLKPSKLNSSTSRPSSPSGDQTEKNQSANAQPEVKLKRPQNDPKAHRPKSPAVNHRQQQAKPHDDGKLKPPKQSLNASRPSSPTPDPKKKKEQGGKEQDDPNLKSKLNEGNKPTSSPSDTKKHQKPAIQNGASPPPVAGPGVSAPSSKAPQMKHTWRILCVDFSHGARATMVQLYLEYIRLLTVNTTGHWLFNRVDSAGAAIETEFLTSAISQGVVDIKNLIKPVGAQKNLNEKAIVQFEAFLGTDQTRETRALMERMRLSKRHGVSHQALLEANHILCFGPYTQKVLVKLQAYALTLENSGRPNEEKKKAKATITFVNTGYFDEDATPAVLQQTLALVKDQINGFLVRELNWVQPERKMWKGLYRTRQFCIPSKEKAALLEKKDEVVKKYKCLCVRIYTEGPDLGNLVTVVGSLDADILKGAEEALRGVAV